LLEDVVEDVLEVKEVRGIADVDELGGHLLVRTGRLVVGDPELRTVDLRAFGYVDLRAFDVNLRAVG
jgi:hypothetical protein